MRGKPVIHTFPERATKVLLGHWGIGKGGVLKTICRGVWIERPKQNQNEGNIRVPANTPQDVRDELIAEVNRLVAKAGAKASGRPEQGGPSRSRSQIRIRIHSFPAWATKVLCGRHGIGPEGRLKTLCPAVWIEAPEQTVNGNTKQGYVRVPANTDQDVQDELIAEVDRLVAEAEDAGLNTAVLLPFVKGPDGVWKVVMQVSVSMAKFYLKVDPFRSKVRPGQDRQDMIRQKVYLESRTALDFRSDPSPLETIAFADCCDRYAVVLAATDGLKSQLESVEAHSVYDAGQVDFDTFGIVLLNVDLLQNIDVDQNRHRLYVDPRTGNLVRSPSDTDIIDQRLFKLASEALDVLRDVAPMQAFLDGPHTVYSVHPDNRLYPSSTSTFSEVGPSAPAQLNPAYLSFDLDDDCQFEFIHVVTARHGITLYSDLTPDNVSLMLSDRLGRPVAPAELQNQ